MWLGYLQKFSFDFCVNQKLDLQPQIQIIDKVMSKRLRFNNFNNEPWTEEQILRFKQGLVRYRGNWEYITAFVKTKSILEVYAYSQIILEELPQEMKNSFMQQLDKEEQEFFQERVSEMPKESFFAQKIQPVVSGGYRGLFSLIEGFTQPEGSPITNEQESE